jgi:hypothetical protein
MKRLGWSVVRVLSAVLGMGVVAGAGALLAHRFAKRDGPAQAVVAVSPAKTVVNEENVTSLRREVARLRGRQDRLEASCAERNDSQSAATTTESSSLVDSLAQDKALPNAIDPYEYRDQLQQRWEEQALDPEWTELIESEFIGAFDDDALWGAHLLEAQCGSTLCRVEYAHENALARHRFRIGIPTMPALRGAAAFGLPTDEHHLQYVLFMTRKGEALPTPE